jgi:alkanesulfonate monooxygenase SsuD/methylene tetrahydromethanopterin reductase-like flavin-dependent oxidoreductase (luciferase family)
MTSAVAAATNRIMVGTLVARATLRPPAMLRNAFDTLARIAPGRIIAGLGAGDDDSIAEDRAFGVLPADPPDRSGNWVAAARPAEPPDTGWVVDGPRRVPVDVESRERLARYRVERFAASVAALSGRTYPVWVAGSSPAAIRLAAAADGWNSWGGTVSRFAVAAGRVSDALAAAGRGRQGFALTWGGLMVLGATPEEARAKRERFGGDRSGVMSGTPVEVAEQIAAYAAAGAGWVILGPVDSSNLSNAAVLGEVLEILRRSG